MAKTTKRKAPGMTESMRRFEIQHECERIRQKIWYIRREEASNPATYECEQEVMELDKLHKRLQPLLVKQASRLAKAVAKEAINLSIVCGPHWKDIADKDLFDYIYKNSRLRYLVSMCWAEEDMPNSEDYPCIRAWVDHPIPHASANISPAKVAILQGRQCSIHTLPQSGPYLMSVGHFDGMFCHLCLYLSPPAASEQEWMVKKSVHSGEAPIGKAAI